MSIRLSKNSMLLHRRFVDHDISAVDLLISTWKFVKRFYEL